MKKLLFLVVLYTMSTFSISNAQSVVIPNYKFKKAEDYAKYEKDILTCINWLEDNPNTTEPDKRKLAEKFILEWILGTPDVSVSINSKVVTFVSSSPNFLITYLSGGIKYILNGGDKNDEVKIAVAGIESVVSAYKRDNPKKDKNIEKLIKIIDKGELYSWIKQQLS